MRFADRIAVGQLDELARQDTPAHRLDARAKCVVTLAFLVAVMSFPRHAIAPLMPFLFYPVALIALGRIPPGLILRKLLAAAPFAALVGLFNPMFDRRPVTLWNAWEVAEGWISFASLLLRFGLTVSAALALVACTGMHRLGAAMERLGLPRIFAVQLLFLYRYLFAISDQAATMSRAVELRAGGRSPGLRVYGALLGHLLLRSLDRAERIHRAMMARGFDGVLRVAGPMTFRRADALFCVGSLAFFAAARTWNLAGGLGHLLLGGAP